MTASLKKPDYETVTFRAKSKKRYSPVSDQALLDLMKSVGQKLAESARLAGEGHGTLVGIFALPTNNVLEIYTGKDGREVGYLFTSLDVWMSYNAGVDYA